MSKILSIEDFNSLYNEYRQKFVLIANSYVQNLSIAEDIVSESFICFWEKRNICEISKNKQASYILGIVKHKCLDFLRAEESSQNRHRNIYLTACDDARLRLLQNDEVTSKIFEKEINVLINKELQKLPIRTAKILLYAKVEGKTYKEISELLNLPVRTITAEMQKALSQLRQCLKDYLPIK